MTTASGEIRRAMEDVLWKKVTGASMAPTLRDGDEVLLAPVSTLPAPGDVVAARRPGGVVLHRVVRSSTSAVVMRGDACLEEDPPLHPRNVLLRAVSLRRNGRTLPIPAAPTRLHRALSRLTRLLARLRGAPGRRSTARRSSSTSTDAG